MKNNDASIRRFMFIAISQVFSIIGSSAVQFALIWHLSESTASAVMLGLSGLTAHLPMALLSPFAGIMADRYDRKKICIITDMSLGIIALIYSITYMNSTIPPMSIILMLLIRSIISTFQYPATQSIMPLIVPKEYILKANGIMQLIRSGSYILGPVLGAMMYGVFPMWVILITDTIGAVLASLALLPIDIPKKDLSQKGEKTNMMSEFKEGLTVYKEDKALLTFLVCDCICMFLYSPLNTFFPLMTSDYFKLPAIYGSIAESMISIGIMVSAFMFSSFLKVNRKLLTCYVGSALLGISCAVGGIVPPERIYWYVFALSCLALGIFSNVRSIPLTAYIQETVDKDKMGRAFSVLNQMYSVVMPISLLIASPLAEKFGVNIWYVISGSLIGVTSVIFMIIHGNITNEKLFTRKK